MHSSEVGAGWAQEWRHSLGYRLWWMLWGWGTVGVIYFLTDRWQGEAQLVPETWIDQAMAYDQGAVWGYFSFFVLIPIAYLCAERSRVKRLARQMQWGAVLCGIIYLLYPTTLEYPPVVLGTWSGQVVAWLLAIDSSQNCVPSLHVLLSLLAVYAVSYGKSRWVQGCYIGWLVWISYTVLQLKRHLWLDVVAAIAVAVVLVMFSTYYRVSKAGVEGDAD